MPLPSSPFTQGGQTQIHKLRMLKQVVISTVKIGFIGGIFGWLVYFLQHHPALNLLVFLAYGWAILMAELGTILEPLSRLCFCVVESQLQRCTANAVLTHPYAQTLVDVFTCGRQGLFWALVGFMLTSCLVWVYFFKKGNQLHKTQKLSGFDLVDLKDYGRFLKKHHIATSLSLDTIPIPQEAETKHFMITGTTGSGKTNAIHHLLQALRVRGDAVVVVDTTGGYVSRFYEAETDTILNPLDARSVRWSLFKECETPSHAQELASLLIPKPSYQSEFWTQSARLMLAEGIQVAKDHAPQKPLGFLQSILLKEDMNKVEAYFRHTNIASYFSGKGTETAQSIRMTLATSLGSLSCLEEGGEFSVKKWVQEETKSRWLFLGCDPSQRDYMQSLLTCWFGLAMKAMMGLEENPTRRVWFIIDELASLNAIPALPTALAELRKYGGCVVVGFQNVSQLEELYGSHITASLSELTGTKLIFQCVDPKVATRMANMLGQQEVLEASENISFGANEIRDGISLSHQKKSMPLVSPTELMQLTPLSLYLKSPLGLPILKTSLSYLPLPKITDGFIGKVG